VIIPTSGRLVLQKIKQEETIQKGSLILPSSQPKQDRYRVVCAAGDSKHCGVHIVYIDRYKGVEIIKDGETYLVIEDQDIIAYEAE